MGIDLKGIASRIKGSGKIAAGAIAGTAVVCAAVAATALLPKEKADTVVAEIKDEVVALAGFWPSSFTSTDYIEPEFTDDESRTNNAFNVADFGEQGNNGWFYRYGSSQDPARSRRIESFDGERYYQPGKTGLEVKSNFLHTAEGTAPILEWRAAEDGDIDVSLTYVKNVNNDKNPYYPDGVTLYVYKGEEAIGRYAVDAKTDSEEVVEEVLSGIHVDELESLYFVVDPNMNNAYDGGSLYVAINEAGVQHSAAAPDKTRIDNNAYLADDFGVQGHNGWTYMCGKSPADARLVSTEKDGEFMNSTSPSLSISRFFIHPAINDAAMLSWQPAFPGAVEIRGTYTKFEQNDGNPNWPDGVTVSIYKNSQKLFSQKVAAPASGTNVISFREKSVPLTAADRLYFVVDADGNASYDGGSFDISIYDRSNVANENDVVIPGDDRRENYADVKYDFGKQGDNGWFYQEGFGDEPFGCYNMPRFDEGEYRYFDSTYLEIKNDFVNPGRGKSAVIKWKVARDGIIRLNASYTKYKNEDKNPAFPDGTRVTLYHNEKALFREEFEPDRTQEITKRMDVPKLAVKKGDYLTMVINGKENNAYDAGNYEFSIYDLTDATTENDIAINEYETRQNFADVRFDFGKQGDNGWFYQEGLSDAPFDAFNIRGYDEGGERYADNRDLEIKRDFVNPGKGKSAVIKWKVAQDGVIRIDASYTKLKNEDKNSDWPDGTRVMLYRNNELLASEDFLPDREKEITKRLDVPGLDVARDDYITMVISGKGNNAYDAGEFEFSIKGLSALTGETEKDVINWDKARTNNADIQEDFGKQGNNGWCFQYGYYNDPSFAVNLQTYIDKDKYTTMDGVEIKRDYIMPGNKGRNANVKWVAAKDGKIDIMASYTKHRNEDKNPSWPDGVTVFLYKNGDVLRQEDFAPLTDTEVTKDLSVEGVDVRAGDRITLVVDGKENTAYDGGNFSFVIEDAELKTMKMVNDSGTNRANLAADFGEQGSNGWYYLEGRSINKAEVLTKKTEDGSGYISRKQKNLEVKKDVVQPRLHADAMYKWVVAEDGKIDIEGEYVKFGHNDPNASWPDGVSVCVYHNSTALYKENCKCFKGEGNDNTKEINIESLEVKKGDIITFDIGCNKNNAWDGGRLSVNIYPVKEISEGGDDRSNKTNLYEAFGQQGSDGWRYGMCDWDGKNFEELAFEAENSRYYNNGKPELKRDFVEPGNGRNAAYAWEVAQTGKIRVKGSYTKFANSDDPEANGVCMRIFVGGEEKKWIGGDTQGNFDHEVTVEFSEEYSVHAGDIVMFAVDPDGNDSYDGGRLTVSINDADAAAEEDEPSGAEGGSSEGGSTEGGEAENPGEGEDEGRSNTTSLAGAFGEQGSDGWTYGMCDWNGANFAELPYDADSGRYFNDGKPELKSDFVEPGNGRNAAYRWKAAKSGTIRVRGSYTKFANSDDPEANGTCMRIFVGGEEKKWIGGDTQGNFDHEVTVDFYEEYFVNAGDIVMFAVDPDGNDSYDGGRLVVEIEGE
ncbi:hypothetical protein [Butyrivibrio sp. FCS014]|uniref:hypothetical protein n=1 Tax=Butyrivibrio sp. FCS014 TaxID=1408304 RepID=UPI0004661618|nr:hypothetical protein [Butyrivibrio sp. FCS014]